MNNDTLRNDHHKLYMRSTNVERFPLFNDTRNYTNVVESEPWGNS